MRFSPIRVSNLLRSRAVTKPLLKPFLWSVTASFLFAAAPEAKAGVWNLSARFSEGATTEEMEQFLLDAANQAAAENPVSYLSDVYAAMFEPEAVKIPFQYVKETAAGQEILQSGNIYYSKGDLFILNDLLKEDTSGITDWGTNFATIDGQLYSWKTGADSGVQLTRFQGDTIELLDYWVDPAMLMRFTYLDYQQKPEDFEVITVGEETYLRRKSAPYGFAGMRVETAPHWMSALVTISCKETVCDASEETYVIEIDRPIPIEAIPADVQTLPEGITFEPSTQTADSYLTYL